MDHSLILVQEWQLSADLPEQIEKSVIPMLP